MREIKFRVWDILNKKMLEWGDIFDLPAWEIFPGTPEQRPFEVMQYTGLKDRKGKDIFEGDIVAEGTINYVVAFYAGAWRLKQNIDGDTWWKSLYRYVADFRVEVIGNVYENQELLKEGE
ncbi:YopX family protein [Clostridium tyrobutyricum]|uniref:YopX family protein n=1 Tax=Clostridium tyrobutyricum TaxID=1519 RepID=UPI000580069B|nr:YopX family protein [Clostridium tyrobutyricum]